MKIIDLLNKIANGEASDLTTRFIFRKKEYSFYSLNHSDYCLDRFLLNQEVEIIEEDKKIEKLERHIPQWEGELYCTKYNEVADKINEIIEEIEKIKDDRK